LIKAVAALAVHMLVERNSLAYSDAVSKFWPEFAKNGKESVTIEDILNHKAGLAALIHQFSLKMLYLTQRKFQK